MPKSVTVVLSDATLVITLHGALSDGREGPGQKPGRCRSGTGVSPTVVHHSSDSLRQEIKRITGVEVRGSDRGSRADDRHGGAGVFTTGTTVQVFLLAGTVPADTWSRGGQVKA